MDQTFFLSHVPPTVCIDDSFEARMFLKGFTDKLLSSKPQGILVVSAHWDTSRLSLTTNPAKYDTIHDFDGFPDPMYQTFFLSHGPPTMCIDDSFEARLFLKGFTDKLLSSKPQGILVVSAHWDTSRPSLTTNLAKYDTIHDFDGFPDPMYRVCFSENC